MEQATWRGKGEERGIRHEGGFGEACVCVGGGVMDGVCGSNLPQTSLPAI